MIADVYVCLLCLVFKVVFVSFRFCKKLISFVCLLRACFVRLHKTNRVLTIILCVPFSLVVISVRFGRAAVHFSVLLFLLVSMSFVQLYVIK